MVWKREIILIFHQIYRIQFDWFNILLFSWVYFISYPLKFSLQHEFSFYINNIRKNSVPINPAGTNWTFPQHILEKSIHLLLISIHVSKLSLSFSSVSKIRMTIQLLGHFCIILSDSLDFPPGQDATSQSSTSGLFNWLSGADRLPDKWWLNK